MHVPNFLEVTRTLWDQIIVFCSPIGAVANTRGMEDQCHHRSQLKSQMRRLRLHRSHLCKGHSTNARRWREARIRKHQFFFLLCRNEVANEALSIFPRLEEQDHLLASSVGHLRRREVREHTSRRLKFYVCAVLQMKQMPFFRTNRTVVVNFDAIKSSMDNH